MESNKTPIAPIELTDSYKSHPLLNHLVRLALRMREHGWIGSKCLTYEMENPRRIRVEYSINASVYHKRIVLVAEQENIRVVNTNPTHFKPVGSIVDAVKWNIKELHSNILGWSDIPQSLKQAMRWTEFEYHKDMRETRDEWLGRLMTRSPILAVNEASTPAWLSHVQSILEFEHPLNSMVHQVVSDFLPEADLTQRYQTMLQHYTVNSRQPTLCDTLNTIMPIMIQWNRTWPSIRLHKDRHGEQHFVFSTSNSVLPVLHVKQNKETKEFTLLDCECTNLDDAQEIHEQLRQAMKQPSIPLDQAWLLELRQLRDFQLLELGQSTNRPEQRWIRSVKNYAEQLHVEMVRHEHLVDAWTQHFIQLGDRNVVTTVLAAMKIARDPSLNMAHRQENGPELPSP